VGRETESVQRLLESSETVTVPQVWPYALEPEKDSVKK
jgi:hypothetical protein